MSVRVVLRSSPDPLTAGLAPDRPMPVTVTATNGPVVLHEPIFIEVLPVGVEPW